jgi:hypothetical protein
MTDKLGLHNYRDDKVSDQTHFKRADAHMLVDDGIDILRREKYGRDREFSLCSESCTEANKKKESINKDDAQSIYARQ